MLQVGTENFYGEPIRQRTYLFSVNWIFQEQYQTSNLETCYLGFTGGRFSEKEHLDTEAETL
jgi:hypothetical protein